jgi:uncharacterized protein (TIRG00374 family)
VTLPPTVPAKPSPRSKWAGHVLHVLGVALLVFVVFKVHWRDSVVLADGTELTGTIVGDAPKKWDANDRVVFRPLEGAERTLAAADLGTDRTGPQVNEGLIRIVRESDKDKLLIGLVLMGLVCQIGVARWWLLLRAQDIRLPFLLAHRLTFIGFFFNNVVPGPTGGDVVKAVYAAKRTDSEKRAQAVVTVVIDRVVGIIALALIAAAVLATKLDNPKYSELAAFIGLFLAGVAVGGMLFFSRRIRRLLRVDSMLTGTFSDPASLRARVMGIIRKADEAVFLWRGHKKALFVALLLSFANQLCIQGIMILFASALHITKLNGDPVDWWTYMAVLPVAFIVSALPLLPGGWGIREAAFVAAFGLVDVGRNPAIALSVVNGMMMLFWSLLGGVYFLLDRDAIKSAESSAGTPE